MVEDIVNFASKLYAETFADIGIFQDTDIGLEFARSAANRARRVANSAKHNSARVI